MLASVAASGCADCDLRPAPAKPQRSGRQTLWSAIQKHRQAVVAQYRRLQSPKEAINLAEMSREIFATDWIKLEVIGDDYNLQPCPFGLVEAADELIKRGFKVLPYCTDDLVLVPKIIRCGLPSLNALGSPIGTGLGLMNKYNLKPCASACPRCRLWWMQA